MLLYFVQNVFFKSKIILLCVIIAIQHTSSSETSARKTQLAKQDRGRKRPLRKSRCKNSPVKLVLKSSKNCASCQIYIIKRNAIAARYVFQLSTNSNDLLLTNKATQNYSTAKTMIYQVSRSKLKRFFSKI